MPYCPWFDPCGVANFWHWNHVDPNPNLRFAEGSRKIHHYCCSRFNWIPTTLPNKAQDKAKEIEGMSQPTSPVTQNAAHRGTVSRDGQLPWNQNDQGNWMEEMRGSLMVVATVIATLTFQIAINPPGGVWQADTDNQHGCAAGNTCKAGTSVLASGGDGEQKTKYEVFVLLCTISFSASHSVILFLITGFPLRNRLVTWSFTITMCISVICLAGAYVTSIWMVMHPLDSTLTRITLYYALFWGVLVLLLCLALLCRFVFWLVKMLWCFLCCWH